MTLTILMIFAAVCLCAAVGIMIYAFTYDKPKKEKAAADPPEPPPTPGGSYILHVEGMQTEEDCAFVVRAIEALGVTASAEPGKVTVKYQGIPAIDFLDRLKTAVARQGYTVTEIE